MTATYGVANSSKPDFNSVQRHNAGELPRAKGSPGTWHQRRRTNTRRWRKIFWRFRDKDKNGVIENFSELSQVSGVTPAVVSAIQDNYTLAPFTVRNVEIVGPKVGAELRIQAIRVTLYALAGMLVYIAFRFYGGQIGGSTGWASKGAVGFVLRFMDRIIFGVAAVLAVFHDVLITLGLVQDFRF